MKKATALALILILMLSTVSCSVSSPVTENYGDEKTQTEETITQESPKDEPEETKPQTEETAYEITDTTIKTWTNSIGTTWMQGIVEVTNTGSTNLYLSSGKYEIDDENGNIVAVKDLVSVYPQVIAPGEKAYYYEETTLDSDSDKEYTLIPTVKVKKATVPCIRYETSNFNISNDTYGEINAIGKITNTSSEDESMPLIAVRLFDSNDRLIGLLYTYGSNISAGETSAEQLSSFSLPKDITAESVDHFDVLAYPTQLQFN